MQSYKTIEQRKVNTKDTLEWTFQVNSHNFRLQLRFQQRSNL